MSLAYWTSTAYITQRRALPICWSGGVINKGELVELLRKHPYWDEKSLAVVLDVAAIRETDVNQICRHRAQMCELGRDLGLPSEDLTKLDWSLCLVTENGEQYIGANHDIALIEKHSGVKCGVGQRASRVANKVCKQFGLDKHEDYNAKFAKLADSLNPLYIPRMALLSVHPCDYLEMSNVDNSWESCHNLEDGAYRAGTLSYLADSSSMIFYTIDSAKRDMEYEAPKVTREVFCYTDGILLQSRLYPDPDDMETMTTYRNLVQQMMSECLGAPNLWSLEIGSGIMENYVTTGSGALQYPDYIYECYHPSVSLLRGVYAGSGDHITVGCTAYCLSCTGYVDNEDDLYCYSCGGGTTCAECGCRVHGDGFEIDGHIYCDDCTSYCDLCREDFVGETTEVHVEDGRIVHVCRDCLDELTAGCDECEDTYLRELLTEVDDKYLCPSCLEALPEAASA